MAIEPTYEELEQKVKKLEKEAIEHKRIDEALRDSEVKTCAFMNTVEEKVNNPIIEYSPFADTQKQRISTIQETDYE